MWIKITKWLKLFCYLVLVFYGTYAIRLDSRVAACNNRVKLFHYFRLKTYKRHCMVIGLNTFDFSIVFKNFTFNQYFFLLYGKMKSLSEYFVNIYWGFWKMSFISYLIKVILTSTHVWKNCPIIFCKKTKEMILKWLRSKHWLRILN